MRSQGSEPAVRAIDEEELRSFRSGLRRRYSDEQILGELKACAERLGRSPTMRDLAEDDASPLHPQTVVERFGSWNAAKRRAGLAPRRFATREDLLERLRELGEELGRVPTGRDLDERRETMPSKSLLWHTFGSLTNALRDAGFDVPRAEERLERALEQGRGVAYALGRLPAFADWARARREDAALVTEWQIYRLAGGGRGAWSSFQYLLRERLLAEGAEVDADGAVRGGASGRRLPRAPR